MEKRVFVLVVSVMFLFIAIITINSASAELNLRVTGSINNFSSDVRLKTNSDADLGFDGYDMPTRSPPSSYSEFYSSITGYSLAIDSWPSSSRTLNLVYSMSPAQTGALTFSWSAGVIGDSYTATFRDYGDDSGYSSQVGSANMKDQSTYSRNITGESDIYIQIKVTPVTAPSGENGGGRGIIPDVSARGIVIGDKVMDIYIALNQVKTRQISLYNEINETIKTSLSVMGLEDYLIIKNKSFDLAPGKKKNVDVRIVAPEEPGIYTGKIIVRGVKRQEILVTLNVHTEELLFDIRVVIPDNFKKLAFGEKLQAQTTLIPMGDNIRLDVILNYLIKDFEGRTFLTESETMLIDEQKTFVKKFPTQNLPTGNYILGLELEYPNGVATSSSHFEVVERALPTLIDYRFILLVFGIGILVLIIIILLITRKHKNIKKQKLAEK